MERVKKDFQKESLGADYSDEIGIYDVKLDSLQKSIKVLEEIIERKKEERNLKKEKIFDIEGRISNRGQTDENFLLFRKEELKNKNNELDKIKESIVNSIKHYIPFLIVYDLVLQYEEKLSEYKIDFELDNQLKRFRQLINQIKEYTFDEKDISELYKLTFRQTEFYSGRIEDAFKKFTADDSNIFENQLFYGANEINHISEIKTKKEICRTEIINLKKLETEISDTETEIDLFSEANTENSKKNDQDKQELASLRESFFAIEKELESKENQLKQDLDAMSQAELKRNKALEELKKSNEIEKKVKLTERLIDFFNCYIDTLLKTKLKILQENFYNMLNRLIENIKIISVDIDDNFNISIKGVDGNRGIDSFSSGEKQFIATAMIHSISQISNVECFVCIDTPLARISKENRIKIAKEYYPIASKQVIILATETEIEPNSEMYTFLSPFIAHEYKLVRNEERSYFEKRK